MWGISTLTDSWPTQMTACTMTHFHIICHSARQSSSKQAHIPFHLFKVLYKDPVCLPHPFPPQKVEGILPAETG